VSWVRSEPPVQAWLGAGRIALACAGENVVAQAVASPREGLATLVAALKDRSKRRPVRLWLASDLCTLTSMPAVAGVKRLQDAQAAASAWLQSQGRVQAGWTSQLAESPSAATHWRVALWPDDLLDQIQRQLAVQSVRPWWSWALQQPGDHGRGLCAYDGAALVFCEWDAAGQVATAETVGPMADISAARRLLKRRSVQQRVGHVFAHVDWAAVSGAAANDAAFAFAPWVRWGDAL
jgi:hypothetical protein